MDVRRAIIIDGSIKEKKLYPGSTEIDIVSNLLEADRIKNEKKIISRFTTQLVEECIRSNDPDCWIAAVDDIDTGDFDVDAAVLTLKHNDVLPGMFVNRILESKTNDEIVDKLTVLTHIISSTDDVASFSKSISINWKAFANLLINIVEKTPRVSKTEMYTAMSKMINAIEIGTEAIVSVIEEILKHRKFELLAIFASIDANIIVDVLPKLIAAVKSTSGTNRYGIVSLIAKVVKDADISEDLMPTIEYVMRESVRDSFVDIRTMKAVAFLIEKCSSDQTMRDFATLIRWTTG
jgi:hypothetical protein